MDNQIISNNGVSETGAACECLSPGRCSMVQKHGLGRHQATATMTKRRRKWTQDYDRMVMKFYYESVPTKVFHHWEVLKEVTEKCCTTCECCIRQDCNYLIYAGSVIVNEMVGVNEKQTTQANSLGGKKDRCSKLMIWIGILEECLQWYRGKDSNRSIHIIYRIAIR